MSAKDLTLVEHLEELRKRIIVCLVFLCVAICCAFPLSPHILKILKLPAAGLIQKLAFFGPTEAFMAYFKIATFSALVISAPLLLYQVWAFISPAIEERFKKYTAAFVILSSLSFMGGCLFAYFLLLPAALKFLLSFGQGELEPVISVGKYISFVVAIILCTGLVFEMPVLSFILSKLGVLNHIFLRKRFKYAVLIIFIAAAVITPTPDVFNMTLLAIPMLLLYEISIWVSFLAGPKTANIK
jgi:sec-independent protein translocase protein TatC